MRTLVCETPFRFEYADAKIPVRTEGKTLLKIKRIGICGTDLHAFEGTQPFFNYPRILGHELAAEIVETDAAGFVSGETVTLIPYFNCGTCIACRNGKPNCCASVNVCGVHSDGGMQEYFLVPSYSLVHGQGLGLDELALTEPLAIGAHGIRRADTKAGEFVLIIGAGPIGIATMEFAKIAGAKVIAMDINEKRLAFCKEKEIAEYTINPANDDVAEKLKIITNGDMPTLVIDATGNRKAINSALPYLAHGGRFVLIGLQREEIVLSHPEFHKREATLMSSRNATRQDFEFVVRCLKEKRINPSNYITHRVKFAEVKDEFASWLKPENGVIKAMVEME
ncbi:MAG: zinc-binding alcohol dehydrogenase family protein [Bacteroidetes bacterium]|nr:zinc-binding alcohol dehydrogenase family protein [Bacteroidota bacterium]